MLVQMSLDDHFARLYGPLTYTLQRLSFSLSLSPSLSLCLYARGSLVARISSETFTRICKSSAYVSRGKLPSAVIVTHPELTLYKIIPG